MKIVCLMGLCGIKIIVTVIKYNFYLMDAIKVIYFTQEIAISSFVLHISYSKPTQVDKFSKLRRLRELY